MLVKFSMLKIEICMWGRNIMMGYLNREDKTTEDVDEEGWFHSGDLGVQDEEGFLQITGEKNSWVSPKLGRIPRVTIIIPKIFNICLYSSQDLRTISSQ